MGVTDDILGQSVGEFILTSFTEFLMEQGYTKEQALAKAHKMIDGPGLPGFPPGCLGASAT
jgi:hypothetical protein